MSKLLSKRNLLLAAVAIVIILAALFLLKPSAVSPGSSSNESTDSGQQTAQTSSKPQATAKSDATASGNQQASESGSSAKSSDAAVTGQVATNKVKITKDGFLPSHITVKKDTQVTWTNDDSSSHALDPAKGTETGPHSPPLAKGQSYTYTFQSVGTFNYICVIHPSMSGKVTVTE